MLRKHSIEKPKAEKITDDINARELLPVEWQNDPHVVVDDSYVQMAAIRAANQKINAENAKRAAKEYEEEQRRIQELEKKQREDTERMRKLNSKRPERQFEQLAFGKRDPGVTYYASHRNPYPQPPTNISIEPGIDYLREQYRTGRLLRLDEQTANRLIEFAKPDETYTDLINRLLDLAITAAIQA